MQDQPSRTLQSKLRQIFWPIENKELGKFIPMAVLMFFILFNQNVLRILKDSILISEISVEVSSFAKLYCVTPAATLFVIVYSRMVNRFTFAQIYYYLSIFFLSFFLIFAFIIYPNVHHFHIDSVKLSQITSQYPHFKWYIILIGNWSYVAYYTLAELWPNIFYVLLFWQFANEITTTQEATRFYTLFSLFGNSSLVLVGLIMMNLAAEQTSLKKLLHIADNKVSLVQVASVLILVANIISCLVVRYITKNVMTDPSLYKRVKMPRSTKEPMGLIKSFKYIASSKYLWLMLICSAAFALSMNLVEAVWKAKIKDLYPTVSSYAEFNSIYILWTGVVIMFMTIVGNNIIRNYGWLVAAVIAPIIMIITGIAFFTLVVFDNQIISMLDGAIIMTPLALSVLVGAIQNILAKGTKYSIWDTSREMLYIPLDDELRTKGKAAVDVISAKIGKSFGGLIQSLIFTIMPFATVISISPILMIVFTMVCVLWIYAINQVYKEYKKIV